MKKKKSRVEDGSGGDENETVIKADQMKEKVKWKI